MWSMRNGSRSGERQFDAPAGGSATTGGQRPKHRIAGRSLLWRSVARGDQRARTVNSPARSSPRHSGQVCAFTKSSCSLFSCCALRAARRQKWVRDGRHAGWKHCRAQDRPRRVGHVEDERLTIEELPRVNTGIALGRATRAAVCRRRGGEARGCSGTKSLPYMSLGSGHTQPRHRSPRRPRPQRSRGTTA